MKAQLCQRGEASLSRGSLGDVASIQRESNYFIISSLDRPLTSSLTSKAVWCVRPPRASLPPSLPAHSFELLFIQFWASYDEVALEGKVIYSDLTSLSM